ncbi:hypothetical protein [Snodgrassella alvi]|jgi:MinD superfamily P-loop ATPase|uniref:hypothetical protein n=1 Tax=Snodgrassella alvi TaxID=1196083 RepID=UPI000C1EBCCA|nr:hypothetical protein [Snodgrassella alvi]PIT48530.1 hypothetical protein BHC51_04610 [Snodgrassella alvi]
MGCCGKKPSTGIFARARDTIDEIAANYQERLKICGNCTNLKRFHEIVPLGTPATKLDKCGKCGCFVAAKAVLFNQKCPDRKW